MKQWKEILLFIVSSLLWIDIFVFVNNEMKFFVIIPISFLLALLPIMFKKKILHWFKMLFTRKSHTNRAHG